MQPRFVRPRKAITEAGSHDAPRQRARWDAGYRAAAAAGDALRADPWLERWTAVLALHRGDRALDLGCGRGVETGDLAARGHRVVGADGARQALRLARDHAPEACGWVQLELTEGLPFADGAFRLVVASLCLHYFPWAETLAMMDEIHRCLAPGGHVLVRVNSTLEVEKGIAGDPTVEPGLHLLRGRPKRFFDGDAVRGLFGGAWSVVRVTPETSQRFGRTKHLWEAAAARRG